jgi:hypothetical protein
VTLGGGAGLLYIYPFLNVSANPKAQEAIIPPPEPN